jgi:hypothetical protein
VLPNSPPGIFWQRQQFAPDVTASINIVMTLMMMNPGAFAKCHCALIYYAKVFLTRAG